MIYSFKCPSSSFFFFFYSLLFYLLKSHTSLFSRDSSAKTKYAKAESRENGQILWPHCSSCWGDQWGGLSSLLWWVSGIDLPLFPRSTVPVMESDSFIGVWYSLHIVFLCGCSEPQQCCAQSEFISKMHFRSLTSPMPWFSSSFLRICFWTESLLSPLLIATPKVRRKCHNTWRISFCLCSTQKNLLSYLSSSLRLV